MTQDNREFFLAFLPTLTNDEGKKVMFTPINMV
jgi:hypothetical protein